MTKPLLDPEIKAEPDGVGEAIRRAQFAIRDRQSQYFIRWWRRRACEVCGSSYLPVCEAQALAHRCGLCEGFATVFEERARAGLVAYNVPLHRQWLVLFYS